MKVDTTNPSKIIIEFEKEDEDKNIEISTPKNIGVMFTSDNSMVVNIKSNTAAEDEEMAAAFKRHKEANYGAVLSHRPE